MRLAIRFEQASAAYYRDMLSKASQREVKELLMLLEQQELAHERILKEYEIPTDTTYVMQFPPSFNLSMPVPDSDDPSYNEMLEVAIQREKKSCELYKKAAGFVTGDFSKLLEGLATFEKEHEEKLKSLQQYY